MAPLTKHYARKPKMVESSSETNNTKLTRDADHSTNPHRSSRNNDRDKFIAAFASMKSHSERLLVAAAKEHNKAQSSKKNQAVAAFRANEESASSSSIDGKTVEAFVLDAGYSSIADYTNQLYQNEDDLQFLDGLIMFVDPQHQQPPKQQDKKKKSALKNTERKVSRAA